MFNRLLTFAMLFVVGGCANSSSAPAPVVPATAPAPKIALNRRPSGLNTVQKVKNAIAKRARLLGGKKPSQSALYLATYQVLESAGTFKEALAVRDVLVEEQKRLEKLSATAKDASEKARLSDLLHMCYMKEHGLLYRAPFLRNGFPPSGKWDYLGDKQRGLETARKMDAAKK